MRTLIPARLSIALLALLFVLSTHAAAQPNQGPTRGMRIQIPAGGETIDLYDESHALVIGVSDYTNGWPSLPGVKRDIEAVSAALQKQGFQVEKVLNPTRAQFDQAIRRFISRWGQAERNRLLIYYAGHGQTLTTVDGRELGYIVPADAPPSTNSGAFKQVAVSMSEIETYALQIEARHVLFVFDSCFSGSLFEAMRGLPDAIASKTARPVRQFITAGTAEQSVPDNSVFCGQFIEGLNGEADLDKDGFITGSELGMFLENKVTNYSKRAQTPRYGKIRNPNLDKGDIVFVAPGGAAKAGGATAKGNTKGSNRSGRAGNTPTAPADPTPPAGAMLTFDFNVVKVDARGTVSKPAKKQARYISENLGDGVTLEMVQIPAGSFMMGSPEAEKDRDAAEGPRHKVSVPSFYMGKFEVTQAQWRAVAKMPKVNHDLDPDPSYAKGNDRKPVEQVSWQDATEFCARLSRFTGKTYRLPTEAEWEHAARAGTDTPFAFGETVTKELVVYNWALPYGPVAEGRNHENTYPVGYFEVANNFGLYDMHGNVAEWCLDAWHKNYEGAPADGSAWERGGNPNYRVVRGGSMMSPAAQTRSAYRRAFSADFKNFAYGFRVVMVDSTR